MGRTIGRPVVPFGVRTASDTPRTFHGRTLRGRIVLDGAQFEECVFRDATLVYLGGPPPQIQRCEFIGAKFEFGDAAGRTLALLQAMSRPSSGLREVVKSSLPSIFGH